jgi:hypothetical protein
MKLICENLRAEQLKDTGYAGGIGGIGRDVQDPALEIKIGGKSYTTDR